MPTGGHNKLKDPTDLVGKRFGKLEVTEYLECLPYKNRKQYWYEVKCDCGEIDRTTRVLLLTKHKGRCNICPKPCGEESACFTGAGDLSGRKWSQIRRGANDRNLSFTLSVEEAWNLFLKQERKCALTGLPLNLISKKPYTEEVTASLDRIDSSRGYELDNVQWVHKDINLMKWDHSLEKFIELCQIVSNYQGNKHEI